MNQRSDISTLNGRSLKVVDMFTNLGSCVSSNENEAMAWTAIDRLSVISDEIKGSFSGQCSCQCYSMDAPHGRWLSVWRVILTVIAQECCELNGKSHGGNIQQRRSCMVTIQIRRVWHAGHCRRRKNKVISNVLRWASSYRQARVGRPARTYLQLLCTNTGCRMEDLSRAMGDRDERWEKVREIRASGTPWCWWVDKNTGYNWSIFYHEG